MPLDHLQRTFANALLNPEHQPPPGVIGPAGQPAAKRFAVYRNNVTVSLIEAMAESFPVVQKIVGEEFFSGMARIYVRQNPPKNPILMFYGEDFPDFLGTFEPVRHLAYLPDVARLELLRRQAYHAADAELMPPDALAGITPEKLPNIVFQFHPSVRILQSIYPVLSIWEWNNEADENKRKPLPGHGEGCLITRPDQSVEMRRLPPGAGDFLEDVKSGRALGEAAERQVGNSEFDLAANLAGLLESGAFAGLTIKGTDDD